MRILIAEDDPISRRLLLTTLEKWSYEVLTCSDGAHALVELLQPDAPNLAILDWMMPELDGAEICRRVRAAPGIGPRYLMLLTAKHDKSDVVAGLDAGADDYLAKPFDREELRARVQVGARVAELQASLDARVRELEEALTNVKQLRGLLPICCYCKKIRDDKDYWQQVETYLVRHTHAQFSHGICPTCFEQHVRRDLESFAASPRSAPAPH